MCTSTGRVRLVEPLGDAEPEYIMTVEVTDGCLSAQGDLTIRVRLPPTNGSLLQQPILQLLSLSHTLVLLE